MPLNLVLLKSCDIRGVMLGEPTQGPLSSDRVFPATLMTWYAEGKIRPHIAATYPLEEMAQALQMIVDRKVNGRVIVRT
jgi:NADPH2:quinone reductase